MNSTAAVWKRLLLFAMLLVIGGCYVFALVYFKANSTDFVAESLNDPARAHAAARPLKSNQRLEFGTGDDGVPYLGSGWHSQGTGWHVPEPEDATWSNWPDAWIFLASDGNAHGGTLRIDAEAQLTDRDPHMTVTLSGNGLELKTWQLRFPAPTLTGMVELPAALFAHQPIALRFHIDAPSSPWHRRTGDDMRTLGIRLRSVELTMAEND